MKVEKLLHMAGGAGDSSYAANSKIQEKAILKITPILDKAVTEVHKTLLPEKMVVADLGCSSGPNTFLVLTQVMKIIAKQCRLLELQPPEMQFFLNDLPGNDFNNIFQSLDYFEESVKTEKGAICVPHFVAGLPGSFYKRLFPSQSVHFFHSSYSLMWISQVPEGLESKGEYSSPNKGNIYIGKTSPPLVVKLYQNQFNTDFSLFLKLRFKELVPGGQMVLAFLGRKKTNLYNGELSSLWGLVSESLHSMVLEGIVEEEKLDSFNLPFYAPSMEEAKAVINAQGLFDIIHMQIFESNWDPYDDSDDDFVIDNVQSGANFAMCIRSVLEPIIASHFGASIVDELFSRFAMNVAKHLVKEKTKLPVLTLCLKKKE
ncbi:S-adenosyl-L-methionine-dependent methyltransferase superfamily protein [Rhynchospora pubera]|uniref:S-adenosyl-L-methionine-dependent methyltransferase superfamily protein n=1 Tax=Rhynchospora pubera TaxID=906938 RepID=A0AAV8FSE4_9POAL|nr:S-adenosyl-L-methionine-dependent methyltransferase superfamily protein [Rhynchospora pubera]KAJ4793872.1 S-adenosyl-L-methionine-dependent methyltransferase superfamily protein [Rhynchospora pubera]